MAFGILIVRVTDSPLQKMATNGQPQTRICLLQNSHSTAKLLPKTRQKLNNRQKRKKKFWEYDHSGGLQNGSKY